MALMISVCVMPPELDNNLIPVKPFSLENYLVENISDYEYSSHMREQPFRQRVIDAMERLGMTKAEAARRSGVNYHALDKFLKGATSSMSAERTKALADALGISLAGDESYEELRSLFFQLPEERRAFLLDQLRALVKSSKP